MKRQGDGGQAITIAIVEDNRLVREGMAALLAQQDGFAVVLAATTLDVAELKAAAPAVVLLDVGLQDGNSLRLAESMMDDLPESRVVVMDLLPAQEDIVEFVNAGVAGFILKDATLDEFVATIRQVAAGTRVLPPTMTTSLFSQVALAAVKQGRTAAHREVRMTSRERDVVALIAEGMSNREIAEELGIASETVKSHVRNVMDKLALHSRLQIAAYVHAQAD